MKTRPNIDPELKAASKTGHFAQPVGAAWTLDVQEWRGEPWIGRVEEGVFTPFSSAFLIKEGVRYIDQENRAALLIKVWIEDGSTVMVELDVGDLVLKGGSEALAKLRRAGLRFSKQGMPLVLGMLLERQPTGGIRYDRPGFRDGMFIPPTGEALFSKGRDVALSHDVRLQGKSSAGTLDGWRDGAAFICSTEADAWQAALLAGFIGPIVSLLNIEPPVFIFEGATSSGKSTAQAIAAAAWANPKLGAGLFTSLHGTVNSVEVQLARGSGTLSALDEGRFQSIDTLMTVCFAAAGGQGKARLKSSGAPQKTRSFSTPLLLSAETRTSQRLEAEGLVAPGGLAVRLTPVSMANMPAFSSKDMTKVQSVLSNFGHSGPAFVNVLDKAGYLKDPDSLRALLDGCLLSFKGVENPIKRRAASGLALMATALHIAKEGDLLPESATHMPLLRIWNEFLKSEMAPQDPVERAIDHLLDNLVARRGLDVLNPDQDRTSREAQAYVMETKPNRAAEWGERVYVVRAKALSNLSGNIADDTKLRKELANRGIAIRDPNKPTAITWTGFPGLAKTQYLVLRADMVEAAEIADGYAATAPVSPSAAPAANVTNIATHRASSAAGVKRCRF